MAQTRYYSPAWDRQGSYIEIIEFWNAVFRDELRDSWVSLAHPAEELWNTHRSGRCIALL